jgi:hypothetical protein
MKLLSSIIFIAVLGLGVAASGGSASAKTSTPHCSLKTLSPAVETAIAHILGPGGYFKVVKEQVANAGPPGFDVSQYPIWAHFEVVHTPKGAAAGLANAYGVANCQPGGWVVSPFRQNPAIAGCPAPVDLWHRFGVIPSEGC